MGREYSVESLWMNRFSIRSADLAPAHQDIRHLLGGVTEDLVLHRDHRAGICLLGDPTQRHTMPS